MRKTSSPKKTPSPKKTIMRKTSVYKKTPSPKKTLSISHKSISNVIKLPYLLDDKEIIQGPQGPQGPQDCISRCKTPLRNYQVETIRKFMKQNSMLVVHGTGFGKTLTALAASQCYLDEFPNHKVVVISPASLLGNFYKESSKYGITLHDKHYEFYSFNKFSNMNDDNPTDCLIDCKNKLLIIDEVHNVKSMGKRFDAVMRCAKEANKVLLLTATPFINEIGDFDPLLMLLYQDPTGYILKKFKYKSSNDDYQKSLETLAHALKDRVSYITNKQTADYAKVNEHYITVQMDEDYYRKSLVALEQNHIFGDNPEVFYHGFRRIVNDIGIENYFNKKIDNVVSLVKGLPTIIYSNWITEGTEIIEHKLDGLGITYDTITGMTDKTKRLGIVDKFNEGLFNVLIITKAGSEGLDLKGVRNIIVVDPPWNPSTIEQIIGRGVRFRSHEHLDPKDRVVNVYFVLYTEPKNYKQIERETLGKPLGVEGTGDMILYRIIINKKSILRHVNNMLMNISVINPYM